MKISRLIAASASAFLLLASASCRTQQDALTYFVGVPSSLQIPIDDYTVKIEPSDELLIVVSSVQPEATAAYNLPMVNPAQNSSLMVTAQPRHQTYIVDSQGCILMPVLGKVHVAGLTTEQVQAMITAEIEREVSDPIVRVELLSFIVDVAGEVKNPGRYTSHSPRYSVLDALTDAGDLTAYGMRDNVLVVREENGMRTTARLNLNDAETLSSPYYFLKQNDYIYVEPTKVRKDNADYNQNNSFKLSVVSTIVSGCSVLASLIIALTR